MVREVLQGLEAEIKAETGKFFFVEINPKKITLLDKNANKMSRELFATLIKNIQKDGELSSVPFCYVNEESGELIVISGNHRVMASIEAGFEKIIVLVAREKMSRDDVLRIQLGHNSIHGVDDRGILEELLAEFSNASEIALTGINQEYLKQLPSLEKISVGSFEIEQNEVVLHFNNLELKTLKDLSKSFENVALAEVKNEEMIEIREFAISQQNIINLSRGLLCALKMARNFNNGEESIFDENEIPLKVGMKFGLTSKDNEKRFNQLLKKVDGDIALLFDLALDLLEKNFDK